jgi:ribosomal protein L7/L12
MPTPLSDGDLQSLTNALLEGRKIEAIKLCREATGLGLKEAKDAVEELELSLRQQFPEKFASRPKPKGCLGGAAVVVGIGFAMVGYALFRR